MVEFFNFNFNSEGQEMNRWFPSTIQQFASLSFPFSSSKLVETILYRNGFFDIRTTVNFHNGWPEQEGWNENVHSFFINWPIKSYGTQSIHICFFKTDGTYVELGIPFESDVYYVTLHTGMSFGISLIAIHDVSPCFFLTLRNHQIDYFHDPPQFHTFDKYNTTSKTSFCRNLQEINSLRIYNKDKNIRKVEINPLTEK